MTALETYLEGIADTPAGRGGVAFFDLDRTLIGGYSVIALAWETVRHGTRQGELAQVIRLLRDLLRHRVDGSGGNYHRLVRRVAKALTGVSEATLTDLGERAYRNHIARNLYREAISLVEAHRAAGHRLVIISAASRYQVEPVARVLGIDEICCTRLEVQEGRFTGRVIAPLCHGEGKLLAARRVARQQRTSLRNCWFYTDSSDDLPLLRQVGRPVTVNPSDRLGAHARARDWPQLHFDTRGLPRLEDLVRTVLTVQTVLATTALGAVGRRMGAAAITNANRMTRLLGDVGSGFAGLDFEIEGAAHLRRDRPAIFVFNHQSLLDSLVLAHLLREDVVAFCKQELAGNPLAGPLLRQVETIFVDRDARDQSEVLRQALDVLASGRSLVIAPEGTRSTLGEIQPFKHGAFLVAKKAGVPIIPIVLHNVKDALPKGGWVLRPATIRITVLPPLRPEQMGGVRQASQAMEERYSELLGKSTLAALPYRATA